jgi:predicted hotdog family 3-hydroxylacyl-ACP dehydratase
MESLAPIESLLPHRTPLRWIDALIACDETTATATATFPPGHFAVSGQGVIEIALVECVAQTVAAASAWRNCTSEPKAGSGLGGGVGMLAAINEFEMRERVPAGARLRIEVRNGRRLGSLLRVAGEVYFEDRQVAGGELTIHA